MTDYDSAIERADRLRTTVNSVGWKDIVEIINNKKAMQTQIALTEKEHKSIIHAQAYVSAINDILAEIDALITVGEEAGRRKK